MRILAMGAHPDDIEYGCGGTLLKYSIEKHDIFLLVLTQGEVGGRLNIRKKEQELAAKMLKAKKIFSADFKDTALPSERKIVTYIDEVIKKVNPDEVYVNHSKDTHQDHRMLANCALASTRYIKRVLFYEDYTSYYFEPDIFVDIGKMLSKKVELLNIHKSQVTKVYPTELDMLESVKAMANYRGFQGKVKYAEGFKAFRYLKDI